MTSRLRGELTVHEDPAALSAVTRSLRLAGHPVVLVPTMGALHAGHRALIRAARAIPSGRTVVSIYLNPLQFGSRHDLDRYPRSFDADLAMCREEGVELVFAPSVATMSPPGGDTTGDTTVSPGALGAQLEGASRAGHFAAVLTVVATLFGIVAPDRALFGEKDYQQLVLVQRMVADLQMGVQVLGVPTARDADGLALSSRNIYLDAEARGAAVALSAALSAGAKAGGQGHDAVLAAAGEVLARQPAVALDYLALRNPQLGPAPAQGPARLLLAATVGTTRLIDNVGLQLSAGSNGRGAP
ncbi:MAG: pantoate--beta-alanine ligase [Pseudonocardiales bacterium]|nr:pantoate--beta-alanine ligase [Pseudonocardiales bacterium]PZS30529.1 MAG: pantoate--beta-alanine ligase [Pseudonocardiales bacterium]